MKIIGKTSNNNYLVEISGSEIWMIAGGYWSGNPAKGYPYTFDVGTMINPHHGYAYLTTLHQNEAAIRKSVGFLRGVADMIDAGLPTSIVPPETDAAN